MVAGSLATVKTENGSSRSKALFGNKSAAAGARDTSAVALGFVGTSSNGSMATGLFGTGTATFLAMGSFASWSEARWAAKILVAKA
jgi:hypothetical protein